MFQFCVLILAMAAYSSGQGDVETTPKFHFIGHEYDETPLGTAVAFASVKLLGEAYDASSDKNVIASPLGVLMLLSMYAAGAANEGIKEEIVKAVGLPNNEDVQQAFTTLSTRYASMDASYLTLANKLYVDETLEVAKAFADGPVKTYHSEVEKVKFSDAKAAAAAINHWAEEKTKGLIKNAVSEDALDSAVAALVNVIFFQGHWDVPFNASLTSEQDFHVDKTKAVKKPMMHLQQPLFYHESPELGAKMVELPYNENHFRMVVVLPNEVDGLQSVIEKAKQKGLLSDVFKLQPVNAEIVLDMPKFEVSTELDLTSLLPKVGVSKIFNEPATGIVNGPVKVSKAFQKAFVKVDEEGATAGAFTGFVMVPMSSLSEPPKPIVFKADHPFLYAILHRDVVLFIGTYTH